jgi:hypothetical protein
MRPWSKTVAKPEVPRREARTRTNFAAALESKEEGETSKTSISLLGPVENVRRLRKEMTEAEDDNQRLEREGVKENTVVNGRRLETRQ